MKKIREEKLYKLLKGLRALWEHDGEKGMPHVDSEYGHMGTYLFPHRITSNPSYLREYVYEAFITTTTCGLHMKSDLQWVFGVNEKSATLAYAVAEMLNLKTGFLRPLQSETMYKNQFLDFGLNSGAKVLLVGTDMHMGTTYLDAVTALEEYGAKLHPEILTFVSSGGVTELRGNRVVSIVQHTEVWPSQNCPLCAMGSPALSPDGNWSRFFSN
jgi:orotate phosphoribosyltransferase